jgi:aldehyde:ferredoxin oxidoreductase
MSSMNYDVNALRSRHKLIAEYKYQPGNVERGYNNRTLYVNVGTGEIREKPVSEQMKKKFVGGKGFGLRLLWDAVTDTTKWNDPENEINISPGPIGGNTNYAGSGKSLVVSLSPLTGIPIDSNVGGHFGPYMKFAGFDALEVQGKAKTDVMVFIDGDNHVVQIFEAPDEATDSHVLAEQVADMFSKDERDKIHVSCVSSGKAAEHTLIGCLNFSFYDLRRKAVRLKQAGRGGIGTVFRDKKIRALVAKFSGMKGDLNHPADLTKLQRTGLKLHREIINLDSKQCCMREVGTANIVEVMDAYDLMPTKNFKYGSHPDAKKIHSDIFLEKYWTQGYPDGCWFGCTLNCAKCTKRFKVESGPYSGEMVIVDGPEYETAAGCGANLAIFDPRAIIEINFYCDTYGIDTISFGTLTAFIMECWENGILNRERTGGLDFTWGNSEDTLELMHQMARGEGFGLIAGLGVRRMKEHFIKNFGADRKFMQDIGMEAKGLEYSEYVSKESLAQQGGYALALKGPQHDEAWLIFMDMVNNQLPTFERKAEALHYFPMFRTWFGLQGLCKLPWNDISPADNAKHAEPNKVPEHVQNYVDIYNAVTGENIDQAGLIVQSERVYNFQKAFCLRMGKGLREHDVPPYRAVGPVTVEEYESRKDRYDKQLKEKVGFDPTGKSTEEKMKALRKYREGEYSKLQDAAYARRGWTKEGIPTIEHLKKIGMDLPEVIEVVKRHLK